jgi:hypothetical protein
MRHAKMNSEEYRAQICAFALHPRSSLGGLSCFPGLRCVAPSA